MPTLKLFDGFSMKRLDLNLCGGMLPVGASNSLSQDDRHRRESQEIRPSASSGTNNWARPVRVRSSRFQVPITWADKHGLLTRQHTGEAA